MVYVSTSNDKDKILKGDKDKLNEEVKSKEKELGLEGIRPLHGQNAYQQLKDLNNEAGHIQEIMGASKEATQKKKAAEREAKRKPLSEQLKMYFAQEERKARGEYESRRLVFLDGGFDEYEDTIRMMPYRVLLKRMPAVNGNGGIVMPDTHFEKFSKYRVVAFGDGCYDIEIGDTVMVEGESAKGMLLLRAPSM